MPGMVNLREVIEEVRKGTYDHDLRGLFRIISGPLDLKGYNAIPLPFSELKAAFLIFYVKGYRPPNASTRFYNLRTDLLTVLSFLFKKRLQKIKFKNYYGSYQERSGYTRC